MDTDAWGVVDRYIDSTGQWHSTTRESREALHRAMGVVPGQSPPPDPLRVMRQGHSIDLGCRGRVGFEGGGEQWVDGWMPPDAPLGYHTFWPEGGAASLRVIVAPHQCLLPKQRMWGWAAQLYATRSQQSWGIGDLADLRRLLDWSAGVGAGCVMVNPLSAVAPTEWQQPSPYSPSSRRFRNPLYLRIEEVPGAAALGAELETLAAAGRALNANDRIDRNAVFKLKTAALEKIWNKFPGSAAFEYYKQQQGAPLAQWGAYCVLAERFGGGWQGWPEEYRRPDNAAVARLASDEQRRIDYHLWLQWLLDEQLAKASQRLPLIHDLPVGFDGGGCDGWVWQDVLAGTVAVGSPPDMYNTDGQNWGLPPFVPHRLRAAGYEPVIQTLRAALRHAGGLRIDHVMGLFRLFWIPHGMHAQKGAYVRYRADEMLAILALESHRSGAFIVGEDLGTVEPGMRETLAGQNVLSYRLMWWEPAPLEHYPYLAMVAATTHDLPTLAGVWTNSDLHEQQRAGINVHIEGMEQLRRRLQELSSSADGTPPDVVIERAHARLAQAPSLILTATLEDAVASPKRVNLPGTVNEWPNWSVALPGGLDGLEHSDLAHRLARTLRRA